MFLHSFQSQPSLIIILLEDSKMKGTDSSSSTASGAVIFLSKWAVFVSGPWEGIFSCVGRQCAVTDSNTQRTSAPVPDTQTHAAGDDAGVLRVSPYTGRKWKYIWHHHTILSLSQTHTHTSFCSVMWNITCSSEARFRSHCRHRSVLHYREHCYTQQQDSEMNRDVYMKQVYVI